MGRLRIVGRALSAGGGKIEFVLHEAAEIEFVLHGMISPVVFRRWPPVEAASQLKGIVGRPRRQAA